MWRVVIGCRNSDTFLVKNKEKQKRTDKIIWNLSEVIAKGASMAKNVSAHSEKRLGNSILQEYKLSEAFIQ